MAEIFFILMVVYVAYVIYSAGDKERHEYVDGATYKVDVASVIKGQPMAVKQTNSVKKSAATIKKAVRVKAADVKVASPKIVKTKKNQGATPKIELRTVVMKNLKTGEEAKVAGNYRMVKRWVKDALIEEGLLDKIYKNAELDDVNKAKVAKALSIIKAMDKYKP